MLIVRCCVEYFTVDAYLDQTSTTYCIEGTYKFALYDQCGKRHNVTAKVNTKGVGRVKKFQRTCNRNGYNKAVIKSIKFVK